MKKRLYNPIKLVLIFLISVILVRACYDNHHQITNSNQTKLAISECKVITHPVGESCIPLQPKRIIALDETSMEALLALDLKPIAAIQPNIAGSMIPKLGKKAEGIVSLGKNNQPNIEKMVQLNPDLILGFSMGAQEYKLLSQIAPTVTLDYVQNAWKDALSRIAEITGKSEKAQKLLEEYHQRVQKLRRFISHKLKGKTVSVSRFYAGNKFTEFRTKYSFPGSVITEVGIPIPEIQNQLTTNENQPLVSVSLERLDLINADILFIVLDPGAEENLQKYQNSQLWQNLKAVKNQRVYTVDSSYWIFGNIISANAILDDLFTFLVKAS
ncbi:iron-siderophore ABC transporter substrate-binding protein [Umezakia ovalisporum]|uniref:Iron-siderophore ABC transporter substrate-binding protein n=2 Tax=Umezakia ovalisporum TaxID=75695 RepID=A0AA43H1N7_9CYAN|nr:iron-siderophore ABC transporter substrate-binding protein [Umezakia ovalisporum]MDH6056213.1 iron-siderophore ABC transporter substrate-binding protein [Umezakia ovalisporum FSS-43]MDH6065635.1 iron-siderophore ABC transporter substrate-binding protein [Umezakia ovalisporum FSS-62]MDH6065880.1 iron-siderophore ABC transporter substrate-binding protein [Umezakia ovalisporum APH033B]MDH6072094.1 iron-siderophore ABC transporter substrate-binding protein [Umezakia ovalisporum CobakiLakeA]MDH6